MFVEEVFMLCLLRHACLLLSASALAKMPELLPNGTLPAHPGLSWDRRPIPSHGVCKRSPDIAARGWQEKCLTTRIEKGKSQADPPFSSQESHGELLC